jgi:hypothetical protein
VSDHLDIPRLRVAIRHRVESVAQQHGGASQAAVDQVVEELLTESLREIENPTIGLSPSKTASKAVVEHVVHKTLRKVFGGSRVPADDVLLMFGGT